MIRSVRYRVARSSTATVAGPVLAVVAMVAVSGMRPAAATKARLIELPADALSPRETALVRPERWSYSVGVFNPLTVTLTPRIEVQTHPLLFFVSPNAIVRVAHVSRHDRWAVTGEYGFSVPTVAMRLAQGHLFPSWANGQGHIGWSVVPRAGLVVTRAGTAPPGQTAVLTARADLAVGIPLSSSDAQPLDAPAPVDLLFQPVLNRYRGRLGLLWDSSLGSRWRVRAYGDLFVHGVDDGFRAPSGAANLTTRLGMGVDVGFGAQRRKRLTFGVAWWNADQHAIDPTTWETRRSNDVWPTLDFIWEG